MDWPNTKEELRVWFCEGSHPTHDWVQLEPLVDQMWARERKLGIVDEGYSSIASDVNKHSRLN